MLNNTPFLVQVALTLGVAGILSPACAWVCDRFIDEPQED